MARREKPTKKVNKTKAKRKAQLANGKWQNAKILKSKADALHVFKQKYCNKCKQQI